ncbi:unnamed protein product [Schistosoma margrebowiei]|uniref:Uncharacterized protein n=1 Tax=Schistosoma margrebowiei TaxID=48269 RepID=A0A183MIU0_9TREM|nr:unnamed protein product [Schistosoma margrebowiei]
MVVAGSRQETLNPGFVLLGTRQQGVPVILRELVLPGGFDPISPSSTGFQKDTRRQGLLDRVTSTMLTTNTKSELRNTRKQYFVHYFPPTIHIQGLLNKKSAEISHDQWKKNRIRLGFASKSAIPAKNTSHRDTTNKRRLSLLPGCSSYVPSRKQR